VTALLLAIVACAGAAQHYGAEDITQDEAYPSYAERQLHHAINLARISKCQKKKKKKKCDRFSALF
jgi:hypothetical protein